MTSNIQANLIWKLCNFATSSFSFFVSLQRCAYLSNNINLYTKNVEELKPFFENNVLEWSSQTSWLFSGKYSAGQKFRTFNPMDFL